jgi:DNA-3-methyladenine glycosylase
VARSLTRRFYDKTAIDLAKASLGRIFVHDSPDGLTAGQIVEVEAYCGAKDPGSHAFSGKTPRTEVMFGPPGFLYVYFTYGMHHCCNIVSGPDGVAGAVLIRAVKPLEGIDLMSTRRGSDKLRDLARGPGRFCKAFGLDRTHDGADLTNGRIWIEGRPLRGVDISVSPRIGLSAGADKPWRFYVKGEWASRP